MKKKIKIAEQRVNENAFDEYRNTINEEFLSKPTFRRNKITQGLYWTDLDKDLANQYVREEAWLFGWKYRDNLKLIDHCAKDTKDTNKPSGKIGF